jgi:carbamoyltransferase
MGLASYDCGRTPAPGICTLDGDHLSIPLARVIDHLDELGFVVARQPGLDDIFGFEMRPYVELERRTASLKEERYLSLAGEAQRELERALLMIANRVHAKTKSQNLCVAGGTMLNVTAMTRLLEETPFKRIFVQPAANDAGIAIGAALWAYWNRAAGSKRPYLSKKYDTCLGRKYSNDEVEQAIERGKATGKFTAKRLSSLDAKADALLPRIYEEQIVAVFEGRSEFGPRALGHRSFIASPRKATMKDKMNELKHREWYRPVAPVVLEEDFAVYFDAPFDAVPFMTLSARCKPITSERAPAVRHVDGSARPQTVTADQSPLVHHLLRRMKAEGKELPILINTSLNVDKEPIVETPHHAVETLVKTDLLDAIVIDDWLLEKRR